jgi:hypothetical protein
MFHNRAIDAPQGLTPLQAVQWLVELYDRTNAPGCIFLANAGQPICLMYFMGGKCAGLDSSLQKTDDFRKVMHYLADHSGVEVLASMMSLSCHNVTEDLAFSFSGSNPAKSNGAVNSSPRCYNATSQTFKAEKPREMPPVSQFIPVVRKQVKCFNEIEQSLHTFKVYPNHPY